MTWAKSAIAAKREALDALEYIGGDAYLSAVGEITPHEAMIEIQKNVEKVRLYIERG